MNFMRFASQSAVAACALLALTACETTETANAGPSCDELRASAVHQSRPDTVKKLYPDAVYIGHGSKALAALRGQRFSCAVAATATNGDVFFKP